MLKVFEVFRTGEPMRRYLGILAVCVLSLVNSVIVNGVASAEEAGKTAAGGEAGLVAIGAGIAVAIAILGAALAQGRAVAAALESIGRNPAASGKVFTPMIIGLVFMEALGIFAFVIAFTLAGKI